MIMVNDDQDELMEAPELQKKKKNLERLSIGFI